MNKKPFISVVVCTYNGYETIKDCLSALVKQDYPSNKYEIIVVDDGSTDKTAELIMQYKVKLITHKNNLGIPTARNSGLKKAIGEIIAFIDDDCIPTRGWLSNLIIPYKNKNIIGVGGLTLPFRTNTITEKYMYESGYGNPAPIEFGKSKNPIYRFIIYLKDMLMPVTSKDDTIHVVAIYTLNASFKKTVLNRIGGFDINLLTSEDTDLCTRINNEFKKKKLVFNKKAIIFHKYRSSFLKYLKQIFERSKFTYKYYLKSKKIPPIFPFPFFILFVAYIFGYFSYVYMLFCLLILPQILYIWWPIRVLKKKELQYLLFPYIQFISELTVVIGIFRGFILSLNNN